MSTLTHPLIALALACMLGGPAWAADGPAGAVTAYSVAGDGRDATALERLLHPAYRAVAVLEGKAGVQVIDRATYLGLVRKGAIGGDRRKVQIEDARIEGDLAYVDATLTGAKATFRGRYTLARVEGRWRLLQDAVVMRVASP